MSKSLMVRRSIICGVAVLVAALVCLAAYVHILQSRAQTIVRTAYELSQQEHPPTLVELRERYGERLRRVDCRGVDCGYTATLSNGPLAALGVAPYTELHSSFWLTSDVVREYMLDYSTLVDHRYNVVTHIQIDFCETCQSFSVDPWTAAAPLTANGMVEIGIKTPDTSRRMVLSLNTRCLTRRGCMSIADQLPTVWAKTSAERIACRIQTDKGWIEKPVGWP